VLHSLLEHSPPHLGAARHDGLLINRRLAPSCPEDVDPQKGHNTGSAGWTAIQAMYEKYFGLTERPFSIAPDPRFLYMSQQHREALAHLLYGVGEGGGFVQLTGEVGTGKTTVCRCLLEQLPDHVDVALILNPSVTALELLASVCEELRIPYARESTSIKSLTDALNTHLLEAHAKGRRTVLIIDEAQNLSADALEEVRLLTNLETTREKLLQIILIGQPELRSLLSREDLRQLSQRITARYHLEPIHRAETAAYVCHRLQVCGASETVFTEAAIDVVQKLSKGVPRLINVICDRAMLGGFVEGKRRIDVAIVDKAAREVLPLEGLDKTRRRLWPWLGGGALAAGATLLVYALLFPSGMEVYTGQLMARVNETPGETVSVAPVVQARQQADPSQAAEPAPEPENVSETAPEGGRVSGNIARVGPTDVQVAAVAQDQGAVLAGALAEAGPDAAAKAWSTLYRLWGVQSSAVNDEQACAQAPAAGLRCLQGSGSWTVLSHFDRPAILLLVAAEGRRVPVLLQEVKGRQAAIQVAGWPLDVTLDTLGQHWFGEYRLLWKMPPHGSVSLRPGDRSKDVPWLREQIKDATGLTAIAPDPFFFDAALRDLLESFQREYGLRVDGVAGPRTFIHLNNLSRQPSVPRLGAIPGNG
jgi:general secretion pathway protein A